MASNKRSRGNSITPPVQGYDSNNKNIDDEDVDTTESINPGKTNNEKSNDSGSTNITENIKKQKSNTLAWLIGIVSLLALVCIGLIIALVTRGNDNDKSDKTASTPTSSSAVATPSPSKSVPLTGNAKNNSLTGKTLADDQKDALNAATTVLSAAGDNPKKLTSAKLLTQLDSGDYSVLSNNLKSDVRFVESTPDALKKASYESLVTLNAVFTNGKMGQVKTVVSNPQNGVYVDQKAGTAFIPLGLYATNGSLFSMEMVHVDGKWQVAPYSLVDEVKISSELNSTKSSNSTTTK